MRRLLLLAVALAVVPPLGACGGSDSLVMVNGARIDNAVVDGDPVALLPGGVIALGYLDAAALFRAPVGAEVASLVQSLLPLGAESGFVLQRDVTHIWGGAYSMQGADACAVVQGTFDPDAIRRAAEAGAVTATGAPLVKSSYAGNDLYTAGNVGFVVVTPHTVLAGNETGIRRALDRLRGTKLERAVPAWMVEITSTKNASMALAADLSDQTPAGPLSTVLGGLRHARVLGNFDAPGLNLAGALTYADHDAAEHVAGLLHGMTGMLVMASLASSLGKVPLPKIQTSAQVNDVAFTVAIDDATMGPLLKLVAGAAASRKAAPKAGPAAATPAAPAR